VCAPQPISPGKVVVNSDPQLLDLWHILPNSPCIGMGTNIGKIGFRDIDGQPWASPPAIGCDEVTGGIPAGDLALSVTGWPQVAAGGVMPLTAQISGQPAYLNWDFGDGTVTTNAGFNPTHTWTNPGSYLVTARAFNNDHPEGVSATFTAEVAPLAIPEWGPPTQTGSKFQAEFFGQPGITYEVYTSTNLAASSGWQLWQIVSGTGGPLTIGDTSTAWPGMYYRVKVR
jgi:hypothetical protein